MYICMFVSIGYVSTCMYMYVFLCICMYTYIYICIYIYATYIVCVCIHICIHTYIHVCILCMGLPILFPFFLGMGAHGGLSIFVVGIEK